MEDELEEREMNVLRQKALSTLPKRKGYRDKQGADFGIDALLAGDSRFSHGGGKDRHSDYQPHVSGREHRLQDSSTRGKGGGADKLKRDRDRKLKGRKDTCSSSQSSSRSRSGSRSYSTYSSSGSSTSGSRTRSSSSGSHSSYSSYTRSSYSSSRHSYSASPHSRRSKKEHHSLQKGSHSDPRPKVSSKIPPHRRYPTSSQWYDGDHPPSYGSSRSPPRARKGHPPPRLPASYDSRDYSDDYPPAKRRPPADYPEYRRGPPPPERHRLHSPPPPPPPPAPQRKERVVRHMRRSPLRSPPPYISRPPYGRGPPSSPPPYPPRRGPRRHSFSPPPPPPPRPSRGTRPKRGLVSDHMPSRPPSRDLRSLCGPPIHVRDRLHRRSPMRRGPRAPGMPLRRSPFKPGPIASHRSRKMQGERRRESRAPLASRSRTNSAGVGRDVARRGNVESIRKEKTESKGEANDKAKEKYSADEKENSSAPSLTSPSAQLLWEDGEEGKEVEKGGVKMKRGEEEEGEVEELDYDETMEDLDLHPTGNIDEGEGDEESREHRPSVASDSRPGTVSWDDSEDGEREEAGGKLSASSVHSEEMLSKSDGETESNAKRPEVTEAEDTPQDKSDQGSSTDGDGVSEASGTEDNAHISSPIRVSPDRREPRVVKRSPRHPEGKDDSRLSAKERLYVSKNAIEEKKWRMSCCSEGTSSKLPRSLANRLGPSPALKGRVGGRSHRLSGGHKGSALAIAAEYKRRRQAGELSPREAARATMIAKRINESEHKSNYKTTKRRKPEERSEENERQLDKRIDSIKQMNKALQKRHKEIEKDKQLYG